MNPFKKQLSFRFFLIILITLALVVAGVISYFWYKTWQDWQEVSREIEIGRPEPVIDETADWKVYRNEEYGFILKFPESWADFEVKEYKLDQSVEPGMMPPYYDVIEFKIDRTQDDGKEYYFSIRIFAYSHDNWAVRRLGQQISEYSSISISDLHLFYPYLGENKDYVFSWDTSRGILAPEELGEDLAEDVLRLRRREAESIIATFEVINPLEKTAEWKGYFNPGQCKDIKEEDYTNECYLNSLKSFAEKLPQEIEEKCKEMSPEERHLCYAYAEVNRCGQARPDYRDFCYFQVAQTLEQPSICQNLSVLVIQEACYHNVALSLKKASICKKIQTEGYRAECYTNIAELLRDPSICEEIKDQKARGYCLRSSRSTRPELPIPLISEWKTYINEKHKYSFKHPPKWNFTVNMTNPDTSPLYVIRERISNETETHRWIWFVTIEAWDNPLELSLIDWLKFRNEPGGLIPKDMPFVPNAFVGEGKIEALQVWQGGTSTWDKPGKCFQACPYLNVYFVYDDKAYLATMEYRGEVDDIDQGSQEVFSQILSTFKFGEILEEDKIVQISVFADKGSFDLENKTFEGWWTPKIGEKMKVKIITTDSAEFYRTSEPTWEKEYFTFSELYSNTSPTWPLTVKGIFEKEGVIKADEVFIIAQ